MPDGDPSIDPDSPQRGGLFTLLSRLFSSQSEPLDASPMSGPGSPTPTPSEMRLRVGEFETARVRDVMIPRIEISAVDIDMTLAELLSFFAENAHSRVPVYRGTLDDPVGFVHLKDVVSEISRDGSEANMQTRPLQELKREILFVPASMRLADLLVKMQTSRIHIALVVDEYGGTDGLVSLEDLVEQIVGDIEDEHDEDNAFILDKGMNVWEVDARAQIEDFEEETHTVLTLEDYEDEIDTMGGLVFALAGRVPQRGEIIAHPAGVELEVVDADPRRIKKLRIRCDVAGTPATSGLDAAPERVESVASGPTAGDAG